MKINIPFTNKNRGIYDLDFYFFSPAQLKLDKSHYGPVKFIRDLQTYTRFSTPSMPLGSQTDDGFELSPLNRLKEMLTRSQITNDLKNDKLIYELQMLVNIYRADVRGTAEVILKESRRNNTGDYCEERLGIFLKDIKKFLKKTRELHSLFLNPGLSPVLFKSWTWADETISLITERNLLMLYPLCEQECFGDKLKNCLASVLEGESVHRLKNDYSSAYDPEQTRMGETMAYRDSMLKKWSQSALYMDVEKSKAPARLNHVLAGIAAATAMSFAVIASLYADRMFIRNSMPWAMIIIMSYVFKDRIKEILKEIFGRLMPYMLADQINHLKDPAAGNHTGISRGMVRFVKADDVPESIYNLRFRTQDPFHSFLPAQNVIHYSRRISMNYRSLRKHHTRLQTITEITRLRIDDWLKEMDDPEDMRYRLENGKRKKIKGNRVYPIHLIMMLRSSCDNDPPVPLYYKFYMNKTGLLRLEKVKLA